jgi:hypothetical protein
MFWAGEEDSGQMGCTLADLRIYTYVLYLDAPGEVIAEYRWDYFVETLRRNFSIGIK